MGFGQNGTPSAAVGAFYKFDRSHSQTFNRRNIDARKQWFSAGLYALLLNELKRERAYLKQNPTDKPHFGDGLPFQPLSEMCEANGKKYGNRYSFGAVTAKGRSANVDVTFSHPKVCKFDNTIFGINLVKEKGRWVIDDVLYVADHSTLMQDLKRPNY